ncbi:uncharacterized protein LOC131671105 [Phymastichus coffea]|uniref:uncharacterized protein LOC131671105 n=1 Tax=Phymastichus coffea TaxID=108790 RepID=UPI00273B3541|nr:uncharacterized protein LOC131671105 [Phymastichus coffea]
MAEMCDRIKYLEQKMKTFKTLIQSLSTYLEGTAVNPINAKLRLSNLSALFQDYFEQFEELSALDPENPLVPEFETTETSYYDVATRATEIQPREQLPPLANSTLNASMTDRHYYPKLPAVEIPTFDGDPKEWIAFKNKFVALIHSRADYSNLIKHSRLEQALKGEAKLKLKIFTPSEENYPKAWQTLLDAYDSKLVLITKHLDEFYDLPFVDPKNVASSLSSLVDLTKQHLFMLERLDVVIGEEAVVRYLERRLPKFINSKWQETLNMNRYPTLQEFYDFSANTIFRLRSIERDAGESDNRKRASDGAQQQVSKRSKSARSFVTSASRATESAKSPFANKAPSYSSTAADKRPSCPGCKGSHRLFRCPEFLKLDPIKRFEFAKSKSICRNCLWNHQSPCPNSGRCKICNKPHHTLLHFEDKEGANSGKDEQSTSKTA